jgi:vacuolar protein sorting-associated protein 54
MVYVTVKTTLEECVADSSIKKAFGLASANRKHLHDGFQPQDSNMVDGNVSFSSALVSMSNEVLSECLKMIFEQILRLLRCSSLVMEFLDSEGISLCDDIKNPAGSFSKSSDSSIIVLANDHCSIVAKTTACRAASDLCVSLISDLFSARKEVGSFIKFEEMQHIWKICTKFSYDIEDLNVALTPSADTLRALLLTHAKAFIDQQHISHMTTLAACLDSEKWVQCSVSAERQYAIAKLCDQDTSSKHNSIETKVSDEKKVQKNLNGAVIAERKYKVVWSCLLVMDLIFTDIECASFFESLSLSIAKKITELLRLFNARAKQMVLGAGALHSGAQLQSINTKHLALALQCIDFITECIPYIQSNAVRNDPAGNPLSETSAFVKEEFQRVKKEYDKHREMIFEKFVTIIKAVVQHSLAPQISSTDFDKRAEHFSSDIGSEKSGAVVQVCPFLEGLLTNASMMHQVLRSMLPESQVEDVFLRIFTFIDQQVPILFVMATQTSRDDKLNVVEVATKDIKIKKHQPCFSFPKKRDGMRRMLEEIIWTTVKLNQLSGVRPYTFTMASILGKKMGVVKKSNASIAIDNRV